MSQNPYSHIPSEPGGHNPYGPDFAPTQPEGTSITAIIALVLAICGCICPIFVIPGPIAMVIGGLAILLIAMSGWRKRGIGIAITAICLGLLQCIVVAVAYFGVYQPVMGVYSSAVVTPLGEVLTKIDSGDTAAARGVFPSNAQPLITESDIADFGKRYSARVGKFQKFPSNPIDIWQMYGRVQPAFKAMDDGTGQPMQNVIPIPGKFDLAEALVLLQVQQTPMKKQSSGTGSGSSPATPGGVPSTSAQWQMPVLNIGIATTDGKVEWLIDPDVARNAGRPPLGPGGPGRPPGGGPPPPPPSGGAGPDKPPAAAPPPDNRPDDKP